MEKGRETLREKFFGLMMTLDEVYDYHFSVTGKFLHVIARPSIR